VAPASLKPLRVTYLGRIYPLTLPLTICYIWIHIWIHATEGILTGWIGIGIEKVLFILLTLPRYGLPLMLCHHCLPPSPPPPPTHTHTHTRMHARSEQGPSRPFKSFHSHTLLSSEHAC
jgi:hypothetical protein